MSCCHFKSQESSRERFLANFRTVRVKYHTNKIKCDTKVILLCIRGCSLTIIAARLQAFSQPLEEQTHACIECGHVATRAMLKDHFLDTNHIFGRFFY